MERKCASQPGGPSYLRAGGLVRIVLLRRALERMVDAAANPEVGIVPFIKMFVGTPILKQGVA